MTGQTELREWKGYGSLMIFGSYWNFVGCPHRGRDRASTEYSIVGKQHGKTLGSNLPRCESLIFSVNRTILIPCLEGFRGNEDHLERKCLPAQYQEGLRRSPKFQRIPNLWGRRRPVRFAKRWLRASRGDPPRIHRHNLFRV